MQVIAVWTAYQTYVTHKCDIQCPFACFFFFFNYYLKCVSHILILLHVSLLYCVCSCVTKSNNIHTWVVVGASRSPYWCPTKQIFSSLQDRFSLIWLSMTGHHQHKLREIKLILQILRAATALLVRMLL